MKRFIKSNDGSLASTVEAVLEGAGKQTVIGLPVDPLATEIGEIAQCLESILEREYETRPRVVVLLFRGAKSTVPVFTSQAVCAWAKRFVDTRGVFETARGLADDRVLLGVMQHSPQESLATAAALGCGRAKLLALAGFNEGLEFYGEKDLREHRWSVDDAGIAILHTWIVADEKDRTGKEVSEELLS